MKIALSHWEERIAPVFDVSGSIQVVNIEKTTVQNRITHDMANSSPRDRVAFLVDQDVDTLICGAISMQTEQALNSNGINVISFICGNCEEILKAWIDGKDLTAGPAWVMPGCCGRRNQPRRKGHEFGRRRKRGCE